MLQKLANEANKPCAHVWVSSLQTYNLIWLIERSLSCWLQTEISLRQSCKKGLLDAAYSWWSAWVHVYCSIHCWSLLPIKYSPLELPSLKEELPYAEMGDWCSWGHQYEIASKGGYLTTREKRLLHCRWALHPARFTTLLLYKTCP